MASDVADPMVNGERIVHTGHISLRALRHLIAGGIADPMAFRKAFRRAFIEAQDRGAGAS